MSERECYEGFCVGETVKVRSNVPNRYGYLQKYIGSIGTVVEVYPDEPLVQISVEFSPDHSSRMTFKPKWLQKGRVEWIPDGDVLP